MRLATHFLTPLPLAAAFLVGHLTATPPAGAARQQRVFVAGQGDVIRVPGAATRCVASGEGGFPDLVCDHAPRGRYEVVFFSDELLVYRNGNPDHPAFSARWKP